MNNLQKKLSKQILELMMFPEQWEIVSNPEDDHVLITTGDHSILKDKYNRIMYIDPDQSKEIEQWETFKLKFGIKDSVRFNRRLKKILSK